jgi:hypothetical protein
VRQRIGSRHSARLNLFAFQFSQKCGRRGRFGLLPFAGSSAEPEIVDLLWRQSMANENTARKRKTPWLKLVTLPFVAGVMTYAALCFFDGKTGTMLLIYNHSGSDVRFEKVIVDDRTVWEGADYVLKPRSERPWLDRERTGVMPPDFRAAKKIVELKLVVINEGGPRETVSCAMDNRKGPCFFEACYTKGQLSCGDCQNID